MGAASAATLFRAGDTSGVTHRAPVEASASWWLVTVERDVVGKLLDRLNGLRLAEV
ncbi:MAG TPA: hypothetical protein VIC71_00900 [Gammaproteobacteria bacterium]